MLFEIDQAEIPSANEALKKHFYEDGAVLIRNIISDELRSDVVYQIGQIEGLLEARNGVDLSSKQSDVETSVSDISSRLIKLEKEFPGSQSVIYDIISQSPALHHLASNLAILNVIKSILSQNIVIHPRLIVLMSMPQGSWHLARWHQDYYYNEGPENTATVYAPLQKTTAQNGSLLLALGNHKRGILPHTEHTHDKPSKWHTIDPKTASEFENVIEANVEAGDALMFHSLLPHSARINKSDDVRFVINLRYRDLTDKQFLAEDWRIGDISHAREALRRKQKG